VRAVNNVMPAPSFFRNLGLFIRPDFFDAATCDQICAEMCVGESKKALIYRGSVGDGVLDEGTRKSLSVRVEKSTKLMVKEKLYALKPAIEEHFRISLGDCELPTFLSYGEGAFFKPHLDATDHPDIAARRVSVVIFLNACSKEPEPNCYGGGALNFYGLMAGPKWEDCAFSLEAEKGMLVGFRPDIVHEVLPVTSGQRFTIISFFVSQQ
jgi:SM-20-related protein